MFYPFSQKSSRAWKNIATSGMRKARRFRPLVEGLEDRLAPAAMVFAVSNTNDAGAGSLRQAILDANANVDHANADSIVFTPDLAGATIKVTSAALPSITDSVVINGLPPTAGGLGAASLTIDGNSSFRVLNITAVAGTSVQLMNLTLTNGDPAAGSGGGLLNAGPNTALTNVVVTGNTTPTTGGGISNSGGLTLTNVVVSNNTAASDGGGVNNSGTLTVNNSQFLANHSGGEGGGFKQQPAGTATAITSTTIANNTSATFGGGIVTAGGTLVVQNSTISNNRTTGGAGGGGGIDVYNGATAQIFNSTIAFNISHGGIGGGGIAQEISAGTVTVVNSTIVGNTDLTGVANGAGGISKAAGPTLIVADSVIAQNFAAPGSVNDNVDPADINTNHNNFLGGDPKLGPLQNNGGATFTMAPLPGSPVIDNGSNATATDTGSAGGTAFTADQRGLLRIVDGNSNGTATVDQGAVEYQPPAVTVVLGAPTPASPLFGRPVTLTATVASANTLTNNPVTGTVTFFDNGTAIGTAPVNGAGVATLTVNANVVGAQTVQAVYNGDANYLAKASAPQVATVTRPSIFITGADAGGGPDVKVYDARTGNLLFGFFAFSQNFTGGVRVAAGDVNGDGTPDVICGAGPGGGPEVKVYDGQTGHQLAGPIGDFFPYDQRFTGGIFVASGDVNGDGFADIITAADAGGGPDVKVINGKDGSTIYSFFTYDPHFGGGIRVATGDVNGDGKADIITGAGPGGGPDVKIFNGPDGALINNFFAYDASFTGGVYVASGDVNGDGKAEVLVGPGAGHSPQVRIFQASDGSLLNSFFPYDQAFTGGVRVAAVDRNGDGRADILTVAGPGGGADVRTTDGVSLAQIDQFFAYNPAFTGGLYVAAGDR